jgi:hypothetical protein
MPSEMEAFPWKSFHFTSKKPKRDGTDPEKGNPMELLEKEAVMPGS